ncbi:hypothetical protein DFQ27_005102 [Actinomortierella ambigua]|uniref:Uncharacterized protein n=1 Tax=Actinomortierella ambigua TaxID=1343610 RepID=A0A9P6QMC3_9FUNG|nr:hypothetical protein DFQ27_005102 [Actinomortierella ambigua]
MRVRVPQAVEGLDLYLDYVTEQEESDLIAELDKHEWAGRGVEPNPEMKRRHQHYGGTFSYRYRRVVGRKHPLPDMFSFLSQRLRDDDVYDVVPNSIIVNEYEAGQARRSLVVMNGSSRYDYKHGISKDLVEHAPDGTEIVRSRRVSITYREFLVWEDDPEASVVREDGEAASLSPPSSAHTCSQKSTCST